MAGYFLLSAFFLPLVSSSGALQPDRHPVAASVAPDFGGGCPYDVLSQADMAGALRDIRMRFETGSEVALKELLPHTSYNDLLVTSRLSAPNADTASYIREAETNLKVVTNYLAAHPNAEVGFELLHLYKYFNESPAVINAIKKSSITQCSKSLLRGVTEACIRTSRGGVINILRTADNPFHTERSRARESADILKYARDHRNKGPTPVCWNVVFDRLIADGLPLALTDKLSDTEKDHPALAALEKSDKALYDRAVQIRDLYLEHARNHLLQDMSLPKAPGVIPFKCVGTDRLVQLVDLVDTAKTCFSDPALKSKTNPEKLKCMKGKIEEIRKANLKKWK